MTDNADGQERPHSSLEEEEYRQIRGELVERDAYIRNVFLFSVTSAGAIIWAIIDLHGQDTPIKHALSEWAWLIWYSPAVFCIPFAAVIASQRRALIRAGAYVHIFFEESLNRKGWQTRKTSFTTRIPGESNDYIFLFYYGLLIVCTMLSWISEGNPSIIQVIVSLIILGFIAPSHFRFKCAVTSHRENCIKEWRRISQEEKKL